MSVADPVDYSDHDPIFADMGKYGTAMSWNILTKCEYEEASADQKVRVNNFFHENEDDGQYQRRLKRLADRIGQTAGSYRDLSIIALQEVPVPGGKKTEAFAPQFLKDLQAALGPDWFIPTDGGYGKMQGSNFGNLTLVNSQIFQEKQTAGLRPEAFLNGYEHRAPTQAGRAIGVEIVPVDDKMPAIRVTNLHLRYHDRKLQPAQLSATIHAINELASQSYDKSEPMVIMGDFNLPCTAFDFSDKPYVELVKSTARLNEPGEDRSDPQIDNFIFCHWPDHVKALDPSKWRKQVATPDSPSPASASHPSRRSA